MTGALLASFWEYLEEDDEEEELDDLFITMSGWATEMLDKYPEVGDNFTYRDYQITVLETDNLCATRLQVVVPEKPEDKESEDD